MKQIITVITISATLSLAACSNQNNAETTKTTDATEAVAEQQTPTLSEPQSMPSDQAAFEAGSAVNETTEEIESSIGTMPGEATEGTEKQ